MIYRYLRTIIFLAATGVAIFLIPTSTLAESPPQLQSVTSAQPDGAYGVGAAIEIQAAFDKAVTVASGIPSISLNSGGTATYVSGSGTNTLLFDYSPLSGEGTADLDWADSSALQLNGATVSDSTYGTAANLSIAMPALSASSNIVIDTTAPNGSSFKINGGAYATNAAGVSLTFQYTDDFSTAGEVSLSTDGVSWGSWQSTDSTVSETLSGAGSHTYCAKFRDAAGNETAPVSQTIILDVTAPSGTVSIRNGALATPTGIPLPLTLTASDNVSAFSNLKVRFSDFFQHMDGVYGAWQPLSTNMTYPNNYGGGTGWIYAEFMDEAGNISSEVLDTIVVDMYDPTGSFTINDNALGTASPTVKIAYTVNDLYGSYPVTVDIWSSDDATHQTIPSVALGSTGTFDYTLSDADGVKTIYMQVTDASGRTSPAYSKTITLDRAVPSGTLSLSGAALVNTTTVTLSVGRSGTDVTSMRFSDDGLTWSDWETYADTKSYTLPSGDGLKTIYMQLMDIGGNISSAVSTSVTLDTVAPSAPVITLSTTEPTTQVTVTIDYPADAVTPYEYQIWGENRSNYSGPFVLTSNHTISAYADDAAGNESTSEPVGVTNIDTTPPTGSLSFQEGMGTSTTAVTLLPDDGGTGATQMQFSDDNSAWTNWEPFNTTKAYTLPSGEGAHTVYMRLQDAVGNISTGTISASITVDATPPTGSFSIQEGTITASADVHLLLNDEGSGAVQMQFSDDNVAWSGWEAYANTKSYTLPSGDGLKTIYMQLKDIGGNLSAVVSASVTLDTVAPSAPVITLSTTEPTDQVTVTIDYPADAVTPYEYQIWGENRSNYSGPFVLTSNHTISAYARDTAGNESHTDIGIANIDTTAPSGTVSFKEGMVTPSASVTLLLNDGGTGAAQMQFSDDNTAWSGWEAYSGSRAYTLPAGDGSKTVYVQLKDAAGNVSAGTISATILLDSTKPAQPTLTPSTTEPAQSVSITIEYAGDAVETTYQINDGAITPYAGPFELTSNATVTAAAKDGAGNESSATLTVNNIDTLSPTGTLLMNNGATVTNSVYVTLTLNDGGTGAAQMRFSVDNSTWSEWEAYNAVKGYTLPSGDGGKTVYVQLRDAAGNTSSMTISATIQLSTIVSETANIVSAVTDSTGTMLSVRFDKAMQPNVVIEGLILSGTSSVITSTYAALPGSRVFVLQLSQAIQETNDVTLQVTDLAFHGAHGEQVPGQAVKVFTPHAIAALKASVDNGGPAFGIDDILGALHRQIDMVGGPGFDQEDVQFWLGLIEPRFLSNQTSQLQTQP